jgi:exopolyphosphatase / guanosine-5'-triphosphate,3'-diphosphate pyrophosphatase
MRVAAIDIGSNSIHMIVADVDADGRFNILDRAKDMIGLGRNTLRTGRLSAQAMRAGIRTLAVFRTLAVREGVQRFTVVATSAVREATNGGDFIRRVHEEVGLRVRVIPGLEEARLIDLAVRQSMDLREGSALIMDIGGGSVELILTDGAHPLSMHSFKLGVRRLSEQFELTGRASSKAMARLERYLSEQLDPTLDTMAHHDVKRVIGTSGTLLSLVTIIGWQRGTPPNGRLHNFNVTAEEVARLRRQVGGSTQAERLHTKGLDAKRADLIVAGACLANYVLQRLGAGELVACTWALREGLLLDFVTRHRRGIEENERFTDVRRRSVARLARHLGETGKHGEHVAQLAVHLFDQLAGELALEPRAREWLEFAAWLHDVGHHISHHDHHRHSYYLITNGEMLGFEPIEIEVIAQTARYHRKATPKRSDENFRSLPRSAQQTIRALSAILRVADGLDRSDYGIVRDVVLARRRGHRVLQLDTGGNDAALELWEARQRIAPLEEVLREHIEIRTAA